MPKCPNCGQTTARTEDWACQWCGYPLLSESYERIPKTYEQLKEEKLHNQKWPVREEVAASALSNDYTLPPTQAPKSEPELTPELESKPIPEPGPMLESEPEPVREPEREPTPAAIEVTVEELLSAYEADSVAADAKFANRILKVTGVVARIEVKDSFDIQYIMLSSVEKNLLQSVRCMFDKGHRSELDRLIKGQTVTVQGKYDGSMIEIRIRNCVLVR